MLGSITIAPQSREARLGLTGTSVLAVWAGALSAEVSSSPSIQQPGGSSTGPVTFHPLPLFIGVAVCRRGWGLRNEEACAQPLEAVVKAWGWEERCSEHAEPGPRSLHRPAVWDGWLLPHNAKNKKRDKTSDLFLLVLIFLQVFFQGPIISIISVQRGKSKIREDADQEDPWSAGSLAM